MNDYAFTADIEALSCAATFVGVRLDRTEVAELLGGAFPHCRERRMARSVYSFALSAHAYRHPRRTRGVPTSTLSTTQGSRRGCHYRVVC